MAPDNRPKVLIAGMGRFGQVIARLLTAQKVPFVALEANPDTVADLRRFGNQLYYGDPTRPEMLRAAGGEHIDVFVITVDDRRPTCARCAWCAGCTRTRRCWRVHATASMPGD